MKVDLNVQYPGTELLDNLEYATNYNDFIHRFLVKYSKECQTILDYGAGTGYFAQRNRKIGKKVTCLEVDQTLCERLEKEKFEVIQQLSLKNHFDFVYSLNVLEHVENDKEILKVIWDSLKDKGGLFLYLPAFPILFSSMDKKVNHLRRYNKKHLIKLVKEQGFEICLCRYADSLGFFITLLYKIGGSKTGEISKTQILIYDKVVFPISKAIDMIVSRFLGKNIVLYAKKIQSL